MSALPPAQIRSQNYSRNHMQGHPVSASLDRSPDIALPPEISPTAPMGEAAEVLDLSRLLSTLWQRKLRMATWAVCGAWGALMWVVFVATPGFQATATLVHSESEASMPSLTALVPGITKSDSAANTEVETLRARSLLAKVVAELGLIDDAEFNPVLMPPSTIRKLAETYGILQPKPRLNPAQALTLTIDSLLAAVSVRNIPESFVFEVMVESPAPEKAAAIANALSKHHIDRQVNEKMAHAETAAKWLTGQVAALQAELEAAEEVLVETSAQMSLVNVESLALEARTLKEIRERIASLMVSSPRSNRLKSLRQLERQQATKLAEQNRDYLLLRQLERVARSAQIVHAQFLEQLKETRAQIDLAKPDTSILSPAEVPVIPTRPKGGLMILMGAALAMLVSAGRTLQQEAARSTARTATELEDATGRNVLGQIPEFSTAGARNFRRWGNEMGRRLGMRRKDNTSALIYGMLNPRDPVAMEAVRALRRILTLQQNQGAQVIMVTSAMPEEGKSALTLSLALTQAQLGKRVLVLDADLRGAGLDPYVGTGRDGLMPLLNKKVTLEEAVEQQRDLQIDVLRGGQSARSPADLFAFPAFRRILREARDAYDLIIIDTPPVLAFPDAQTLATLADTVICAVRWDSTESEHVNEALHHLRLGGGRVHGLVLTRVSRKKMRRYGLGEADNLLRYRAKNRPVKG